MSLLGLLPDFLRHLVKGLGGRDIRGLQRLYGFPQLIKIGGRQCRFFRGIFSGFHAFLVQRFELTIIFCVNLQKLFLKTRKILSLLLVQNHFFGKS